MERMMNAMPTGLRVDPAVALGRMRPIEGWFTEPEAMLLLDVAQRAVAEHPDSAIVEIGSYQGRSTVVLATAVQGLRPAMRVAAIDPHEGLIDMPARPHQQVSPTYEALCRNLNAAGVADAVEVIPLPSTSVPWNRPIGLLFIDGLHDYDSVRADLEHFERWIEPGGFVAFHDYSCDFPDVVRFIRELNERPEYGWVEHAGDLLVLRKHPEHEAGRTRPLPAHR